MADMNKPKPRRASQGLNDCIRQPVQAGMPGGKCLIDRVARGKVFRIIHSSVPLNAPLFRAGAINCTDPASFPAAQLLKRQSRHIFFREAHLIHSAYNVQVFSLMRHKFCLPDEESCAVCQRTTACVISDAVLPDPKDTDACIADQFHRPMGYLCSGAQQQHGDCRCRDVNNPVFICCGDGTVLPVQFTAFQI